MKNNTKELRHNDGAPSIMKEDCIMKPRREWEADLVNKMLDELRTEPLCSILHYASWYLRDYMARNPDDCRLDSDTRTMEILQKYADLLTTRLTESRFVES